MREALGGGAQLGWRGSGARRPEGLLQIDRVARSTNCGRRWSIDCVCGEWGCLQQSALLAELVQCVQVVCTIRRVRSQTHLKLVHKMIVSMTVDHFMVSRASARVPLHKSRLRVSDGVHFVITSPHRRSAVCGGGGGGLVDGGVKEDEFESPTLADFSNLYRRLCLCVCASVSPARASVSGAAGVCACLRAALAGR